MSKWKTILGNFAPAIATALGGPLAGSATKYLADKLLGNPNASEIEVFEHINNATPQDLQKLRELDHSFKLDVLRLKMEIDQMDAEDRAEARKLAETNMIPHICLSVLFILGYFGLAFGLFTGKADIREDMVQIFNMLLGILTVSVPTILQFWFGSSHGSKVKNMIK